MFLMVNEETKLLVVIFTLRSERACRGPLRLLWSPGFKFGVRDLRPQSEASV